MLSRKTNRWLHPNTQWGQEIEILTILERGGRHPNDLAFKIEGRTSAASTRNGCFALNQCMTLRIIERTYQTLGHKVGVPRRTANDEEFAPFGGMVF